MKFNDDGFDGLNENLRIYAAAAHGDDADGYEGNGAFDDDDEEEEVVVTMTSDDDEDMDRLEEDVEDILEAAEVAVIAATLPSPVEGYAPAATMSKPPA